jgi:HSP20 family protein
MSLLHRSHPAKDAAAPDAAPKEAAPKEAAPKEDAVTPATTAADERPIAQRPSLWTSFLEGWNPRVEERREDGGALIRFEMPGLEPDKDIEVTVSDGVLRVRAERTEESTEEGSWSQISYGSYLHSVALPAGATDEDITASYRDGVLEVRVQVDEAAAATKRIPVTRD